MLGTINFVGFIVFASVCCTFAQDAPAPAPEQSAGAAPTGSKLYPLDQEKFDKYKEKICPLIPQVGGDAETIPKWNDQLTQEEVFELALLNLGYSLTTDAIAHLPTDLGPKKKIVDMIAYIAKTTCGTPAISSKFITGVKNLFLYYLLKREKADSSDTDGVEDSTQSSGTGNPDNSTADWDEINKAITTCASDVVPIRLTENCGVVETFWDASGFEKNAGLVEEQLDDEFKADDNMGLDIIVDSIWWMFSATYARCYSFYYPDEDIILTFYQRFRDDIVSLFSDRWVGAGTLETQFSIIFGSVEVGQEHLNLRKCATAAYDYEKLTRRHLVRPLMVSKEGLQVRNYKLNYL